MEFRTVSDAIDELKKGNVTCVDLITRSAIEVLREVFAGNGLKVAIRQDLDWNDGSTMKYKITKIAASKKPVKKTTVA